MSDNGNIDVSKVISVLMENPALIAEISSLVKKEEQSESVESTQVVAESKPEISEVSLPASAPTSSIRSNRTQLLGALKPYWSESRAKAIDSMMTIADIIDMMKAR